MKSSIVLIFHMAHNNIKLSSVFSFYAPAAERAGPLGSLASFQALPRMSKVKRRQSLVYFDHVLDVVGRGFGVAVHFAYARTLSLYFCMLRS